ncbi:hypothetical protein V6N11_052899 [Hibiscus sabdariffa]|uniref:RING-type E3 ubiquitin transferase n=1 Tax=Hibiscus sabdariffa TaxID=183260 RepID=A0ABR2UBG0_9ROSI
MHNYGFRWRCRGKASLLLLFLYFVVPLSTAKTQTIPARPQPYRPDPVGSRFNPKLAILMVVIIVCFFMGYFSVDLMQWAERRIQRRNWDWDPFTDLMRRSRRLTRGLDSSVIESFPTFVYSTVKGYKMGKATLECAICLNEFQDDETLRLIPKCDHVFHPHCIDVWLSSHSTCPVCRANLVLKPGETVTSTTIPVSDAENRSNDNNAGEVVNQETDIESQEANVMISQNKPRRLSWVFPRSQSTGGNGERFTLRLPEEFMNNWRRVAFPEERSWRRGYSYSYSYSYSYRSRSLGSRDELTRNSCSKTGRFVLITKIDGGDDRLPSPSNGVSVE